MSTAPRRQFQTYTFGEIARAEELIANGHSYAYVAAKIGHSEAGLRNMCWRHRITHRRSGNLSTALDIALLFGYSHSLVTRRWLELGWMTGRHLGGKRRWNVTNENLLAFIDDPDYWMLWTPASLTDETWRAYATEIRSGPPVWYSVKEVARCLHVEPRAVQKWLRDGRLPSTRRGPLYWIRVADLDGFVIPSLQPALERTCPHCGGVFKAQGMVRHVARCKRQELEQVRWRQARP